MWKLIFLSLAVVSWAHQVFPLAVDKGEQKAEPAGDNLNLNSTFEVSGLQPRHVSLFVNSRMYYVVFAQLNWHSATEYCSSQNFMLASIPSSEDNEKLLQQLRHHGLLDKGVSFWVGASDLGHHGRWFWLSNGQPLIYKNWGAGQPDSQGGVEHCLELLESGKWNDVHCDKTNIVICENRCPVDSYTPPLYT